MTTKDILQETASASPPVLTMASVEGACKRIANARSCIVMIGPEISQLLELHSIRDDPVVRAATGTAANACDGTLDTKTTLPVNSSGSSLFSSISKFCGQLAAVQGSTVQDLLEYLVSSGKLTRLYTDDAHTSFFRPTQDISNDLHMDFELCAVCIHGRATDFVCKTCTSKSKLTQAVLFKAIGGQDITCPTCGAHGPIAGCSGDSGSAFVPELLDPNPIEEQAIRLAESDAVSGIDLLLVLGGAQQISKEWSTIASTISRSAQQTILVSIPEIDFFANKDTPNPLLLVETSLEEFTQGWATYLSEISDHTIAPSQKNDLLSTNNDFGSGLATEFANATLVDSSSPAESSDGRPHGLGQSISETGSILSKQHSQTRVRKQKGKPREKTNFNHLLNFSLPPRLPPPMTLVRPRRRVASEQTSERQAQVSRTTFINANFRFVLKPRFWLNFMPITIRPDMQLRWEWIERVIMPITGESATCPICLSQPTAARVTKCGHSFCLPCILRFLSYDSGDEPQIKKCPVCWSAITSDDLFPVHFWTTQYYAQVLATALDTKPTSMHYAKKLGAGTCITMRLMKRLRGTTICLPRSTSLHIYSHETVERARSITTAKQSAERSDSTFESYHCPWTFTENALPFAKFALADRSYCIREYKRELAELNVLYSDEAMDADSQIFVESSIMNVEYALSSAEALDQPDTRMEERARIEQGYAIDNSSDEHSESQLAKDNESSSKSTRIHGNKSDADEDDFFYFYQANDGQHIYMHPLYMRVLAHEHGGYAGMPDKLEVKIRHSVESTITDDVRQQFRFLNHLSLRCDVLFIEPELKGLASHKSMDKFRQQLSHRDKHHAARAKQTALDEARSEFMAASAEAMASAEHGAAIHSQREWGNANSAAISQDTPDEASFPLLNETSTPDATLDTAREQQQRQPLWPRQPLPPSSAYPNSGGAYDGFWEEFERTAAALGHNQDRDHDDEHLDQYDYDENDPEDFVVSTKATASPQSGKTNSSAQQSSKKTRKSGGLKLVLSGSSARRRR
ncbi:hypothetical protein BX070DRAFT_223762 [Coemansia spiralis]|nr:hypothetical protein BX070DRAFT_223762 [Coemansia spiralis]